MGLLDRFRTARPAASGAPKGASGRGNMSGYVREDDLNTKLVGQQGLRVFDKMWRSDPDVRRILVMLANPIAGATWTVEPYGGADATPEAVRHADFVTWALMERLTPSWPAHLQQVLRVAGRAGFAPFEQVWKADTWQGRQVLALDTLDLRLPASIWGWEQEGGRLTAITQNTNTGLGEARIPAEDLAYYRMGAEGDNWKGESLLRPAYKPWKYKESLELIDSIGHERHHVGTPIAYPPQGATDDERAAMAEMLGGLRANHQGYIVTPGPKQGPGVENGWVVEILSPSGGQGGPSIADSLSYHRDAIAAVIVGEFMRLGQSGVGARATADVQQDPFLAYCEAIASTVIEDTVNTQLVPRLVLLNFPGAEVEGLPAVRASLIDATTLGELADFVQKLSAAEALHPDLPLEDYLRERASLPQADEEARAAREEMASAARDALAAGAGQGADAAAGHDAPPGGQQPPQQAPSGPAPAPAPPGSDGAAAPPQAQQLTLAIEEVPREHVCPHGIPGCRGECEQAASAKLAATLADAAQAIAAMPAPVVNIETQAPPAPPTEPPPARRVRVRRGKDGRITSLDLDGS